MTVVHCPPLKHARPTQTTQSHNPATAPFVLIAFIMMNAAFLTPRLCRLPLPHVNKLRATCPTRTLTMKTPLSPSSAQQNMTNSPSTIYLDVRMPQEYDAGHAPGAINIPVTFGGGVPVVTFVSDVKDKLAALSVQNPTIIVGCKSGKRSTLAIDLLSKDDAFQSELFELEGGFDNWLASQLPVEKNQ